MCGLQDNNMQPVTPGYILRKKHLLSSAFSEDHSLDEYIDYLKGHGLWVHPSIKPAFFSLRNGLAYPGLKTQTQLSGPHLLVKVPKSMLLNTRVANIPALQRLFQEEFYSNKHFNWEDRVIVTFLLYTYAREQEGIWLHMVRNLSKQIDILSFWPEDHIRYLEDPKMERICRKSREEFQNEYNEFAQVTGKYPDLIPSEYITMENYIWLYIHLVSRSFGKFLQHVTMVPFCQLFNHHNSDVLYDFLYNEDNPLKISETKYEDPSKYETQQARAQISSSDGSYDSEQYFDEDEFDYSNIEIHKIKWGGKISFSLKDKQTSDLEKKYQDMINWLEQELYWDDHSIMFVSQVLEKLNIIKNEYMAGRKKFIEAMQSLTKLRQTCHVYKMRLEQFYKMIKGEKFQYRTLLFPQIPQESPTQRFMEDKFDYFTMRMNNRDHFDANNQVYFCYGRLSNRMMLQRYGMAIEGNKYDHLWISLQVIPFIEGYPDTIEKMQEKKSSLKRKFKLKRRQINLELLVFFRMAQWDLMRHNINEIFKVMDFEKEVKAIEECIKVVEKEMEGTKTEEELEEKMKDKAVGYHEYFGVVYRLEHRRILELHLKAYKQMKRIVQAIQNGIKLEEEVKRMEETQESRQMKWYLGKYLKMITKQ